MKDIDEEAVHKKRNPYYGVGGFRAIKAFFANYVNFGGKSSRREFWWTTLFEIIFGVILLFSVGAVIVQHVLKVINSGKFSTSTGILDFLGGSIAALLILLVVVIVLFLPSLAITIRRFRDAGVSWIVFAVLYAINVSSVFIFSNNARVSSIIVGLVTTVMLIIELLPTKQAAG